MDIVEWRMPVEAWIDFGTALGLGDTTGAGDVFHGTLRPVSCGGGRFRRS